MDKRLVLATAGVAVVVTVVWLTTRVGEPEAAAAQVPSASTLVSVIPEPTEGAPATDGSPAIVAAARPTVSAEAPAMPQATGKALPIDVSPGFEFLMKPAAEMKDTDHMWINWRRHQQLQSETRDETWAPRMEAALRGGIQDSLTARGLDTQRIELPVIECRTTGCEIQAIGYAEDNMKSGVDLQTVLPPLLAGSLGNEFDLQGYILMMSSRSDQRLGFLVLLPRKKP